MPFFFNLERDDGSWGNLKINGGSIKYPIIPLYAIKYSIIHTINKFQNHKN